MLTIPDSYKFCPNCATPLQKQADFKICPKCGAEYYFNAAPTITAIIVNDRGEYLLTKRKKAPFKDWWDIPGGVVEEGETFESALKREMQEELGVTIKEATYLGSISDRYEYQNLRYMVVVAMFLCQLPPGANIQPDDDVTDYQFVAPAQIQFDAIAFDNQRKFFKDFIAAQ